MPIKTDMSFKVDFKFSKSLVALISTGRSFHSLGVTVEKL